MRATLPLYVYFAYPVAYLCRSLGKSHGRKLVLQLLFPFLLKGHRYLVKWQVLHPTLYGCYMRIRLSTTNGDYQMMIEGGRGLLLWSAL